MPSPEPLSTDPFHQLAGARLGDRADVVDQLLAAHADAVVMDAEGARRRIGVEADHQLLVGADPRRLGQRLETQPVEGVGGVGDQLAEEDLLVGVEGVDHQAEQLPGLGLEAEGLGLGFVHGHRVLLVLIWGAECKIAG